MLPLALLAPRFQCFSELSYVEGDTQELRLSLHLLPAESPSKTCASLSGSAADFSLEMSEAYNGADRVFTGNPFTFSHGSENVVQADISALTPAQLTGLQAIQNAAYRVKIEAAEEIWGTVNSLNFVKTDISACWERADFVYSNVAGDEFISFKIQPANCRLPEDAVLSCVFRNTSNGDIIIEELPEFEAEAVDGFYQQQPYEHGSVRNAVMRCALMDSQEDQNACYAVTNFLEASWDFEMQLRLDYQFNGFATYLTRDADEYIAGNARECDEQSRTILFLNPKQFAVIHQPYSGVGLCLASGAETAAFSLILVGDAGERQVFNLQMTYEEYAKRSYIVIEGDFEAYSGHGIKVYPEYSARNAQGDTILLLSNTQQLQMNCVDSVVLKLWKNKGTLEFHQDTELQCVPIVGQYNLLIMDAKRHEVLEILPINLNVSNATAIVSFSITFPKDLKLNKLIRKESITFGIAGDDFAFVSTDIYSDNLFIALVPSFVVLFVYLIAGMVVVGVIIRRKHHSDD